MKEAYKPTAEEIEKAQGMTSRDEYAMSKEREQEYYKKERIMAEDIMSEEERQMSQKRFEKKETQFVKKKKSGKKIAWSKESRFEYEKAEDVKRHAPLFFIYRDNGLFEKQVPTILKSLAKMGRETNTQVFPQGTPSEDIEKWFEENVELLSKKAIVSDSTARIPRDIEDQVKYDLGARHVGYLDELTDKVLNHVLSRKLFGKDTPIAERNIETTQKYITAILRNILTDPEKRPEKVLILASHMADHLEEFDQDKGDFYYENKDYASAKKLVVCKIKEWLIESGIDPINIETINDEVMGRSNVIKNGRYFDNKQQEFLATLDNPKTWIITDRHTGIDNEESNRPIRSAVVLKMPRSNFYESAKEHNLIKYSEAEVKKEWERLLKTEFGTGK